MAVRLFWDNRTFDALPASSLVPSSYAQMLPASNVQTQFRSRVWRSGNTLGAETLTIDFGAPVSVDAFIAFFTTLNEGSMTSGDTTGFTSGDWGDGPVTVAGNSVNSWSSPPFSQTLNQSSITDAQSPHQYFEGYFETTPGAPTYRYWQFEYYKSAANQTRDVGRIFLGQTYDIPQAPAFNGILIELIDGSNKSKGVGLQTFVEVLPQFKQITLTFPPMAQNVINQLDYIFAQIGQNRNFFLQIDQVDPYKEIYYVKLGASHKKQTSVVSPTQTYWVVAYMFEEQL